MIPVTFEGVNKILKADGCEDLPAYQGLINIDTIGECPCTITKWELSPEELEKIKQTGSVFLVVFGKGMPPVMIVDNVEFNKYPEQKEKP